ncbi:MAG: putative Multidrug resistance-associated protein [Streblomastix strix]|uniref:Putative Multidrug resistance-associated protein n=1 Tax=Streblomastix strix TaxID=222440 RepID=A0A5J4X3T6_9EUKA|nr:MAG: putative Multidrug resistance-associated protein [Streblomastix strix]
MVIGSVGSGKSSIGAALIGDIEKMEGDVRIRGQIAYCPQTAWINNNTVRGNIIFGSTFEQKKYDKVVHVCALETDFKTLAAGDSTAIGEKGVNLSGGQKAHDPLSAVDAHVGRFLFDECIDGILKGKTRLLMTNQLQFIDRADNIILMKDGEIEAQGNSNELKQKGYDFQEFIIKGNEKAEKRKYRKVIGKKYKGDRNAGYIQGDTSSSSNALRSLQRQQARSQMVHTSESMLKLSSFGSPSSTMPLSQITKMSTTEQVIANLNDISKKPELEVELYKQENQSALQIMTEEEQETGPISWNSYFTYILSLVPLWAVIPFFFLTALAEGITVFSSWWLGVIGDNLRFSKVSYYWKLYLYIIYGAGCLITFMIRSVMNAPSSFFDTTPLGRILNRFTGDISITDQYLNMHFTMVLDLWLGLIGQIVIVSIDTVWILALGLPTLVVFYIVMKIYSRASRNLQRLEAISRSPVLSHFSETVTGAGLSTIRAYHLENIWKQKFENLNDEWSIRFILFNEGKKWATLYASVVSTFFMVGIVLIGWSKMDTAKLSVAISAAMTFSNVGVQIVQQNVEMESKMTSYDRIQFYSSNLPQEVKRSEINPVDPPKNWPAVGRIQFDNVTFRYRSGLPFVLKDVSFDLKGGEKIGVCGRTGAGKSSLLFALFRLVELDTKLQPKMIDITTGFLVENDKIEEPNKGRVLIDGIDISKVDLSKVRRSIAIIPQDPTLFTGTLRYNLDIAGNRSDNEIWNVLGMVEMQGVVAQLPLGLDTQVAEGGYNFSAGQRQLICFGRAILNNCRIVVMDEATASVDVETDAKIQKTIREQFVDKTVFVIAHRLNTIMNSDRIMVMDQGRVAEINSPDNLKSNPESAFNSLIKSLSE